MHHASKHSITALMGFLYDSIVVRVPWTPHEKPKFFADLDGASTQESPAACERSRAWCIFESTGGGEKGEEGTCLLLRLDVKPGDERIKHSYFA